MYRYLSAAAAAACARSNCKIGLISASSIASLRYRSVGNSAGSTLAAPRGFIGVRLSSLRFLLHGTQGGRRATKRGRQGTRSGVEVCCSVDFWYDRGALRRSHECSRRTARAPQVGRSPLNDAAQGSASITETMPDISCVSNVGRKALTDSIASAWKRLDLGRQPNVSLRFAAVARSGQNQSRARSPAEACRSIVRRSCQSYGECARWKA